MKALLDQARAVRTDCLPTKKPTQVDINATGAASAAGPTPALGAA